MENLTVVVFTMKGCPHCSEFKEMLQKENIEFVDRDVDEHEEEYNMFSEVTKNDMVPAVLIIEGDEKKHKTYFYTPETNYNLLSEAVTLINEHRKKFGII
jgi:glutaredoxin